MAYQKTSCDCQVFESYEEAKAHGVGGTYYKYGEKGRSFPDDVSAIVCFFPVTWRDVHGEDADLDESICNEPIRMSWPVNGHTDRDGGPSWELSGTHDKPTLSPSLHWIDVWHGYLRDGQLKSC